MTTETLLEEARDLLDDAVAMRRTLHRHPELGLELPRTQDTVLEAIDDLGLTIRRGESSTSIVADLEGARPGPTIVLRGDMDALPMPEDTGLDFSSGIDGAMHACGHDMHTSMLAGAARILAARREDIAGWVRFMFQPGEEGHHGAKFMLEEGLLHTDDASPITGAFALHVTALFPSGNIWLKGGTMMASADTFRIVVTGKGGHASSPHYSLDPIPVACEIVQALQTFVTRRIDAFDPAVVTVGKIQAGTTNNVIPETAEIIGTIRAVSERTRARVHDGIRRVAEGVAAAHETATDVTITFGYPVTVNDDDFATFASGVARDLLGEANVGLMPFPVMGAEDWSYVLQQVPGSMAFLGAMPPGVSRDQVHPNHSNRVVFDETAMVQGMATYAAVALRHLNR